jgi:type VI secretion system protein ImpH
VTEDPVRFGQNPSLAFAPSTIEEFKPGSPPGKPPMMRVNFFGLLGPNGVMPLHFTSYARERQRRHHDPTLVRFLDVFHHRMTSLFYRAWASSQKTVDLDRRSQRHFHRFIGSLFGYGMGSVQDRDQIPDNTKLFFSGRLACPSRNAEGLAAILQDFFGLSATVETFVGHWLDLPVASQCRLGESPETGSLGTTTIVGARFWECQTKFRIRLGPMSLGDYERMLPASEVLAQIKSWLGAGTGEQWERLRQSLPSGDSFDRLKCWVMNYVGQEFSWDVQLVLEAGTFPKVCLGESGRLGWTSWLIYQPLAKHAEDLYAAPFEM